MKKITYKDFQLDIEMKYLKEIDKDIERIFEDDSSKIENKLTDDNYFYKLLKYAIEIKDHYAVKAIENRIKENICIDLNIRLFLYQAEKFEVSCFRRKTQDDKEILNIFVSQDFFNNLNEDEQVAILGHEIAHHLFNHFKYPAKEIIQFPFTIEKSGDVKSNLIYWSKLSEISADVVGLLSNDVNFKAYSTAIIKHNTGLSDSANSMFSISPLIDLVLNQYENFAKDPYFNDLQSLHPLMHLRVKVINTVAHCRLVSHFGEEVSDVLYRKYKKEYNDQINILIKNVYPEIFPSDNCIDEVVIPMSIAVVLSDGQITKGEFNEIRNRIDKSYRAFEEYLAILNGVNMDFLDVQKSLIETSIKIAKKNKFDKGFIIPILRVLILVAASDGNIDSSELHTIFNFAKEFDISKCDIVFLMETQYRVLG